MKLLSKIGQGIVYGGPQKYYFQSIYISICNLLTMCSTHKLLFLNTSKFLQQFLEDGTTFWDNALKLNYWFFSGWCIRTTNSALQSDVLGNLSNLTSMENRKSQDAKGTVYFFCIGLEIPNYGFLAFFPKIGFFEASWWITSITITIQEPLSSN